MLGRIARRFGFEQSVPVGIIDDWVVPNSDKSLIELAPREGAAACLVDEFGRVQPKDGSWSVEFTFAGGARWVPVSQTERVKQKMVAPGVLETTVQTPAGPVLQRVAAGVVGGQPAAVIEIENTGGVAIALGVVVRPLRLDGRGHTTDIAIDTHGITVNRATTSDRAADIRFDTPAATVAVAEGVEGDLLVSLPDADDPATAASTSCRSGGAQAAAVWPVPHTATIRIVVGLAGPVAAGAAVPTTTDINRGWESHLKQGLRVDVDDSDVPEQLSLAARSVLTMWPERAATPLAISALSELGFGRDAGRLFDELAYCDDDAAILRSLARWAQLGEQGQQLEDLERVLGSLAKAAHVVAGGGGRIAGEAWLGDALVALGGRLHQIDQPDVGDRIQGFTVANQPRAEVADREALLGRQLDKRRVWPERPAETAAEYVRAVRAVIVEDAGSELRLLPEIPKRWRGQPLDVFGLPVANGNLSFGLRWHGPRPALLWEANLAPESPLRITVPGIDPSFTTEERSGEALLADPGWETT